MEMTIDEALVKLRSYKKLMRGTECDKRYGECFEMAMDIMLKYQQLQADYEARLKADMVAMLTEIQLEVEETKIDLPFGFEPASKTEAFYEGISSASKTIQERINALRGEEK